ncbi:MAG: hypothetical protein EA398_01490 [Deltaproteobacteria bacterium]|nr:MAG: hypothetical protein EA398_01490 [Deltaproteobacteria bacterium]
MNNHHMPDPWAPRHDAGGSRAECTALRTCDARQDVWWQGNHIELVTDLAPRFLYLATETHVLVNGKRIAWSGGFAMEEWAHGAFHGVDREPHVISVRMRTRGASVRTLDAMVWIDGTPVDRLVVGIGNLREGAVGGLATCGVVTTWLLYLIGNLAASFAP